MKMTASDRFVKEIKAYETKLLENLTIQDALILIPVFTADIGQEDTQHIVALAHAHSLFPEDAETTEKRINRFANLTDAVERTKAIELATKSLTPELRETAFLWTAELMLQKSALSEEKKEILDNLRIALSIDKESAEKMLQDMEKKIRK
jgi:hypothetical protein